MKKTLQNYKTIILAITVGIGIIIRLIFVFLIHPPEKYIYSDMAGYYERAINYKNGIKSNTYDSFYPPGTHIIYSIFFRAKNPFLWIKLFNVILSGATCILIYLIAKDFFGILAGYIGLFVASFNYIFIDFTGYLMSETIFTFMLAIMFYCFLKSILASNERQRWIYSILSGLFVIIASSVKPSILLFIPLFGIWWLLNFNKHKIFSNCKYYFLGFFPVFIVLVFRIYLLTGKFGVISTNGGLNFFQGRSHIKYAHFIDKNQEWEFSFASPVALQKGYTYCDTFSVPPYESKYFYKRGFEEIQKNVPRTIIYSIQNLSDLFISTTIWPSSSIESPFPLLIKIANIAFVFIIIFPALFISFHNFKVLSKSTGILLTFPIIIIFITSIIFLGDPRYRVPYDVFFIILASYFYSRAYNKYLRIFHQ